MNRPVQDAAREILMVFHYGPHFNPEQNRALSSLSAALDNEIMQEEIKRHENERPQTHTTQLKIRGA